jgi:hypothetical protein
MKRGVLPTFGFGIAFALAVLCGVTVACGNGSFAQEDVPCDPVEGVADAGFCVERVGDGGEGESDAPDGGTPNPANFEAECAALVEATCGESDACTDDPGCVAAELLARFEPERCPDALGDARSFPPCSLGTCVVLAAKVCGGAPPAACEDAPACAPVRALEARADDGDVSANESCASALADEVLFPPCQ